MNVNPWLVMFILFIIGFVVMLAIRSFGKPSQVEEVPYPSEEHRLEAVEALKRGDYVLATRYWTQVRDFHLRASQRKFDLEAFRKGRQESGQAFPDSRERQVEQGAEGILSSMRVKDLESAAEASYMLGGMAMIELKYETAVEHYRRAVEMSTKPQYAKELVKAKAKLGF